MSSTGRVNLYSGSAPVPGAPCVFRVRAEEVDLPLAVSRFPGMLQLSGTRLTPRWRTRTTICENARIEPAPVDCRNLPARSRRSVRIRESKRAGIPVCLLVQ